MQYAIEESLASDLGLGCPGVESHEYSNMGNVIYYNEPIK